MAIAVTNIASSSSVSAGSSVATASFTPVANRLYLVSIATRTGITADPNQPTATGNGFTYVVPTNGSVVYDNTSSSRRRLTVFRALAASPTAGAITFSFGGQTQTNFVWSIDEVTGMDATGTNGSGAIVQVVNNFDATITNASLTVTLAAFGSASNSTFGVFSNGDGSVGVATAGSGFTKKGEVADSGNTIRLVSEFQTANDTSVDLTFATPAEIGGIGIELKIAAGTNVSVSADVTASAFTVQAPTITAIENASTTAGVITALFSVQAPSITAIQNVSTTAGVQSSVFSLSSPTLSLGASIQSDVVSLTFSVPSPSITAIRSVSTSADVLGVTSSVQSPSVSGSSQTTAGVVQGIFTIPDPTINIPVNADVIVSASVASGLFTLPTVEIVSTHTGWNTSGNTSGNWTRRSSATATWTKRTTTDTEWTRT